MAKLKLVKLISLGSLTVIAAILSVLTAYRIGEVYFFDKLFYKKSPVHGYILDAWKFSENSMAAGPLLKSRMADLKQLLSNTFVQGKTYVLGTHDDSIFNIAVIGDSYVYGTGVKVGERFTDILGSKLNKIRPTRVYNLGQMDDDLLDNYAKFKLARAEMNIDLYIITMVQNDFQIYLDRLNRYPYKEELYRSLKQSCPQPHYDPVPLPQDTDYQTNVWLNDVMPTSQEFDNICLLKQFVKDASSSSTIFFNLEDTMPSEYFTPETSQTVKYVSTVLERYENAVVANNGDLVRAFIPESEFHFERISEIEGHPSRKTHEWYAKVLYQEITHNPTYGFKKVLQ